MPKTFEIKIECENAAFEENGPHYETAGILQQVVAMLIYPGNDPETHILRDSNGNKVGIAKWTF